MKNRDSAFGSALAGVLSLALATSATAAEPVSETSRQHRVDLSDIDLETDAGARVALRRLVNAARDVCRFDREPAARAVALRRACMRDIVADAVARIDAPRLTQASRVSDFARDA